MKLDDAGLLKSRCYIDGAWRAADSGAEMSVINPATGDEIGRVSAMGASETVRAVAAAEKALPAWRSKTATERAGLLRRWFELMMENQEDLARLMTAEQGKPLAEARGEIAYAASFVEWFAEEAKRIYSDTIPEHQAGKRILVLKQPIGVCAAITPWNFPAVMITRKDRRHQQRHYFDSLAPFGGMKQSGIGREGSKYGLDEYLEIKYLCIDVG